MPVPTKAGERPLVGIGDTFIRPKDKAAPQKAETAVDKAVDMTAKSATQGEVAEDIGYAPAPERVQAQGTEAQVLMDRLIGDLLN